MFNMTRVQSPPVTVIIFSSFNITQCGAVVFLLECETETHSSAEKEREREREEIKKDQSSDSDGQVSCGRAGHRQVDEKG